MLGIVYLEPNKNLKSIVLALSLAFTIFVDILLGVILGLLADRYLKITPIGIVLGSLAGIFVAFKEVLKVGKTNE